jgi:hypothetical protein
MNGVFLAVGIWLALEWVLLSVLFLAYVWEARVITSPGRHRGQKFDATALDDGKGSSRRTVRRQGLRTDSAA